MSIETNVAQDLAPGIVAAAPWRVTAVSALPNYMLAVTFKDGSVALLDCSSLLNAKDAGVYHALVSPELFEQVGLELGAITWPNGADLDSCWIYDETRNKKSWAVPF